MSRQSPSVSIQTNTSREPNEDIARGQGGAAWVIDGASTLHDNSITESESDGLWFASAFDAELSSRLDDKGISLPDVVRQSIEAVRSIYENHQTVEQTPRWKQPTGSIAVVRWTDDCLEYFVLGDCSVLVRSEATLRSIIGDGPRSLDAKAVRRLSQIQDEGVEFDEAQRRITEQLRQNRDQLNREEGYWALSLQKRAVDHAKVGKIYIEDVRKCYLFSDGFERLKSTFDVFAEWVYLCDYIDHNGSQRALRVLRALEASDPDCREYPRLSRSDDATIATVHWREES